MDGIWNFIKINLRALCGAHCANQAVFYGTCQLSAQKENKGVQKFFIYQSRPKSISSRNMFCLNHFWARFHGVYWTYKEIPKRCWVTHACVKFTCMCENAELQNFHDYKKFSLFTSMNSLGPISYNFSWYLCKRLGVLWNYHSLRSEFLEMNTKNC